MTKGERQRDRNRDRQTDGEREREREKGRVTEGERQTEGRERERDCRDLER